MLREYTEAMKRLIETRHLQPRTAPVGPRRPRRLHRGPRRRDPAEPARHLEHRQRPAYLDGCKERGLRPHPARFPAESRVLHPLAHGSGRSRPRSVRRQQRHRAVAESIGRRWMAIDVDHDYLRGSQARFDRPADAKLGAELRGRDGCRRHGQIAATRAAQSRTPPPSHRWRRGAAYVARAGLLPELSRQTYDSIWKALREAVLNSVDAEATRIDLDFSHLGRRRDRRNGRRDWDVHPRLLRAVHERRRFHEVR